MKRYWQVLLAGLFILVIGVTPTLGADANPNNYVVGKLGFYAPTSGDLSGYDTGFNTEVAFGHYFTPNFAIELGIGYFQTEGDVTVVDQTGFTYPAKEKIEVMPFTLSLRASIPIITRLELYGIGGIGGYYVYDRIELNHYYNGYYHDHISDDKTEFGWHLGGGLNYNISRNFFVGAEFKYVWLTANLYGQDVNLGGVRGTGNFGFRF
ncbi:MAG TPA: outer membrane beta-barrel protein [Syntrophales bacterium]|nr:outer membrane beta-barrel protein [Syntrophales bacterium]